MNDMLEDSVDERYYLRRATIESIIEHCKRKQAEGCGFRFEPTDGSGIAKTINTKEGCRQTDNFIIQLGNVYPDTETFKNRTMGRIYDVGGLCPTINCCGGGDREPKVFVNGTRIRKLTPRECFRLMGVSDSDIDKIQNVGISNTQQYKLAGNAIVVDVLYYIFKNLVL
jgi:DNA (cytosine-5)-methyltransferase 1